MINRNLTYGRHILQYFVASLSSLDKILDIGAGSGNDLQICKQLHSKSELFALECNKNNITLLNKRKINTFNINIEKNKFPFDNETFDLVIANQIFEHV